MDGVKKVLESIYLLYTKLCDSNFFTQEIQKHVLKLQTDIKTLGTTLSTILENGHIYFEGLVITQGRIT